MCNELQSTSNGRLDARLTVSIVRVQAARRDRFRSAGGRAARGLKRGCLTF